jgi:AmmeMemoRadiSam system protein A
VATVEAMRAAAGELIRAAPDAVVVISPHAPRRAGAFGIWLDPHLQGTLAPFGAPDAALDLPNDLELAAEIADAAARRKVVIWDIRGTELDHGAVVPLWFVAEAGWRGPTVVLSLNHPGEGRRESLGGAISSAAGHVGRRLAVIASGDLSHRLTTDAPGGYHPCAQLADRTLIDLLQRGAGRDVASIDPALREAAGEDAVDSTVIALAAAGWQMPGRRVLSYEGPFGVGYGVALLYQRGNPDVGESLPAAPGAWLPQLARQSVEAALNLEDAPRFPAADGDPSATPAVFVTVREPGGALRGCIGALAPQCRTLAEETWRVARLAAFKDARFEPIEAVELPNLHFQVSVLHSREAVLSREDLDPRIFGIIVETDDGRRGVLLPGIPDFRTAEEQIAGACRKGGIDLGESHRLERFRVDCFAESQEAT